MNNQPPFLLLKENRNEFINKKCAICLCALFYPEVGDDFVSCSRLRCAHMFHTSCIDRITKHECPECRQAIITKKVIIDKSIELAIRTEAFTELVFCLIAYSTVSFILLRFGYIESLQKTLDLLPIKLRNVMYKILILNEHD